MPSLLLLALGTAVCLAVMASDSAADAATQPPPSDAPPPLQLTQEGQTLRASWGDALVLELRDGRFVWFRGSPANDHWIGTESHPMDLAWAYQDFPGLENQTATATEEEDGFTLRVTGDKPGVDVHVELEIRARFDAERQALVYTLQSTLAGSLEDWYQHSKWSATRAEKDPTVRPPVEAIDYHLARMSVLDRIFNNNLNGDLYNGVTYSTRGDADWMRIPKLPVAYPVNRDEHLYDFFIEQGGKVAYLDAEEGGWIAELVHSSRPMRMEICWSWYDMHNVIEEAIPPRHSSDQFSVSYAWRFVPTSADAARAILDQATDAPWREGLTYDLPPVSWNNRFDRRFDVETWEAPWWRSSVDCYLDRSVGFDDESSVAIDQQVDRPAAWYTFMWVYPFVWEPVASSTAPPSPDLLPLPGPFDLSPYEGQTYRVTAMVRTENCNGEVRLAVAQHGGGPVWLYSDKKSPEAAQADAQKLEWIRSETLTGTNDWTRLSVTFQMDQFYRYLVLEQHGPGKSWFDNVVIEQLPDEATANAMQDPTPH